MTHRHGQGFSIRIFLPGGDPEGLRIVEKANWSGQGLVFPRALFTDARKLKELKRTGVYILWGPTENGELPRVYVGEGDSVLPRLEEHVRNKDFWTHAVVFTSKDGNLNKAHVQHLESRLVKLASDAKRCELDNANEPQPPSLSEADVADTDAFLDDLLLCLPVLGVAFFERPRKITNKRCTLFIRAKGITAEGYESPEGFVVRKGSQAVKKEVQSLSASVRSLRKALVERDVLVDEGATFRLTQDYSFPSPSTAADVILGNSSSGRIVWKDADGRTLKERQELEAGGS